MNGNCIPKSKICNGENDCGDNSDEQACAKSSRCEPNEFKCRNNKCILKTWRCDGEQDCLDNSDEESCTTLPPGAPCRHDEFQCNSRDQCVPKSFVCDRSKDCNDNSDEIGCSAPEVITPPPSLIKLNPGDTFNISCRSTGFPAPLVSWRLNWGHIPDKCRTTSVNGFGVLTCPNIEVRDSGAYSCELINSVGSTIVSPDTILVVTGADVCPAGQFNSEAQTEDECINCFCFGVTTSCKSADLFVYQLAPPARSLQVVGISYPDYHISNFSTQELNSVQHGIQLRYSNLPVTREEPYYALSSEYLNNQLKSYGGSIRYVIEYIGSGPPNSSPDIILIGNGQTLTYRHPDRITQSIQNQVDAKLLPGHWFTKEGRSASRQEIMFALGNVEHILIKLQYINAIQRQTELLHVAMDSAGANDLGLGSATLVEECNCPTGYTGLSCEVSIFNYST